MSQTYFNEIKFHSKVKKVDVFVHFYAAVADNCTISY